MNYEKFVTVLKNGGFKTVIIYSISSIAIELIYYIIFGSKLSLTSFSGYSVGESAAFIIIFIVLYLLLTAGLYGSSNDAIEGNQISVISFLQNGKKYFWGTLGYTFIYFVPFIAVMTILSYFIPFITTSEIGNLLLVSVFQAIFIPLIILNVTGKPSKGYVKKNYVTLLIVGLVICSIQLIPIAGEYIFIILNGFYPLLILTMCDHIEYTNNKIQA